MTRAWLNGLALLVLTTGCGDSTPVQVSDPDAETHADALRLYEAMEAYDAEVAEYDRLIEKRERNEEITREASEELARIAESSRGGEDSAVVKEARASIAANEEEGQRYRNEFDEKIAAQAERVKAAKAVLHAAKQSSEGTNGAGEQD